MKASISFFAKAILAVFLFSCHNSSTVPTIRGAWQKTEDFAGLPRGNAVGFVIDDIVYVGTGYNFTYDRELKDFWRYDKNNGQWTQVADFPGPARSYAASFTLNGKGYVGSGYDGNNPLSDFYQYDPSQDKWTRIADFGTAPSLPTALPRLGAIGFSINGKAFVGSGSENIADPLATRADFWQYDDAQNQWLKIEDIGLGRSNGWVMVIGDQAYIGGGTNHGTVLPDLWRFNPFVAHPWTNIEQYGVGPLGRELAATFTIGNYGYLVFGSNSLSLADVWQYSPAPVNKWAQVSYTTTNLSGPQNGMTARASTVGFRIGDAGFITTGKNGNNCFDDAWIFNP